jgi:hypothetical protein
MLRKVRKSGGRTDGGGEYFLEVLAESVKEAERAKN